MRALKGLAAIAKGMSITFSEMFKPTVVENYPDGRGPLRGARFQERYRGVHVLQRDENGLEKCVACFLCAANCPANCISRTIGSAEKTRYTLLKTILVTLQDVHAAISLLETRSPQWASAVRVVFDNCRLEHLAKGNAHSLGDG